MNNNKLLKQPFDTIREYLEWRTGDGTMIPIEELEDTHIKNIIIMLDGKQEACNRLGLSKYEYAGYEAEVWIEMLKLELEYRYKPQSIINEPSKVTL